MGPVAVPALLTAHVLANAAIVLVYLSQGGIPYPRYLLAAVPVLALLVSYGAAVWGGTDCERRLLHPQAAPAGLVPSPCHRDGLPDRRRLSRRLPTPGLRRAPGLAARLLHSPAPALIAARPASGVTCAVLWVVAAIAFLAARVRRGWLLTGLLLSVTPAAVALAWSVNRNGSEAAAGAAFVALTLAPTRPGAPQWAWWLMAPVGFFLASGRAARPVLGQSGPCRTVPPLR